MRWVYEYHGTGTMGDPYAADTVTTSAYSPLALLTSVTDQLDNTSGTLTFAPGQTILDISIPILNDMTVEANETISLTQSAATTATFTIALARGRAEGMEGAEIPPLPRLPPFGVQPPALTSAA